MSEQQKQDQRLHTFAQALYNKHTYQYVSDVVSFVREHKSELYDEAIDSGIADTLTEMYLDDMIDVLKTDYWPKLEDLIRDGLEPYINEYKEYSCEELIKMLKDDDVDLDVREYDLVELMDLADDNGLLELRKYSKEEFLSILDEHSDEVKDEITDLFREHLQDMVSQDFGAFVAADSTMQLWLQRQGEIVIELLDMYIWCRVGGHQSAYMDDCFLRIAQEKGERWNWSI